MKLLIQSILKKLRIQGKQPYWQYNMDEKSGKVNVWHVVSSSKESNILDVDVYHPFHHAQGRNNCF